jgi:hypothetical protein
VVLYDTPAGRRSSYQGKQDTSQIKAGIQNFLLEKTGLELNDQKTLITHGYIKDGFYFLGGNVKSYIKEDTGHSASNYTKSFLKTSAYHYCSAADDMKNTSAGASITRRGQVESSVNAPIIKLIEKLIKVGFAGRDPWKRIIALPMTTMVNHSHTTILEFYNSKINGITNYYSFASNRSKLANPL